MPEAKRRRGYRHEPAKFAAAGLTEQEAHTVSPPRVAECPVQLEVVLAQDHGLAAQDPEIAGRFSALETRVRRVHLTDHITADGEPDRVDPDRWRPLIMSFQRFYGLTDGEVSASDLAEIPERLYRTPDLERAEGTR